MLKKLLIAFVVVTLSIGLQAKEELKEKSKEGLKLVEGAWLGKMQIPQGPSLRIGLEIFKKADASWGANVASLDQGNRYIRASTVNLKDNRLEVKLAGAPISINLELNKKVRKMAGHFNQGSHAFELELEQVEKIEVALKAQSQVEQAGYSEQEVVYENKTDGTWLAATLSLPAKQHKSPAVILLSGSGANQRDMYYSGHELFSVIADKMAKRGFAVLRADKRGVFKSGGEYIEGDVGNFAKDTQAAIQYLKQQPQIDSSKIALVGHSEGSMVAAMASELEPVNAIVSLAGPGLATLEVLLEQDQTEPAAAGASKEEVALLLEFSQQFYQTVLDTPQAEQRAEKLQALYDNLSGQAAEVNKKWNNRTGTLAVKTAATDTFYHWLQQDPMDYWANNRAPLLIINGDKDVQVAAETNVAGIKKANDNNPALVEAKVYEGINHMLQSSQTGAIQEYGQLEETINPQLLEDVVTWLEKVLVD